MNQHYQAIVIGAGPAGLVAIKELAENGVSNILALDEGDDIGGNFIRSYDDLMLTSSCTISMFSDFWIGDGNERAFWKKQEVVDYWKRYLDHYGVADKFRFNTRVHTTTFDGARWQVELENETLTADTLVVAVGASNFKFLPQWHEQLTDIHYEHSKDYRNAESYNGKNVVVVGGGESASDVALEVSKVAANSWVSLRSSCGWITPRYRGENPADLSTHRGFWGLPRDFGKVAAKTILDVERSMNDPVHDAIVQLNTMVKEERGPFGIYGTKTTALPEAVANHGCEVVGEIVDVQDGGRTLITSDGSKLEEVDAVIFSTGYKNIIPFFPDEMKTLDPRSLYKQMFHPDFGRSLCLVGTARPCFGSQFPIMEMQARYAALVLSGKADLPAPSIMKTVAETDKQLYETNLGHSAKRIRALVDFHIYLDDMAEVIGCKPPLWQYFFTHPVLWVKMVYGPTQATQFRLSGPNNKKALAHEIIAKIPASGFTHIVKLGLKGRLKYAFQGKLPGQDLARS